MSAHVITPDYNWKQAAYQESVDYAAVQKAFMDQAYGVVANKAKVLFQEPFRLGFEIVHRNEKATKMVGMFAFRVSRKLLYAPVFFINGEIKPADMLYRTEVKRFVPLCEDWCAFLVRGASESSGQPVGRDRRRQADAYMSRLAYPQRTKYASEIKFADTDMEIARRMFVKAAQDGSLWRDMLQHCADAGPMRKLLPDVLGHGGPPALEKLAAMAEGSVDVSRFLSENYTADELLSAGHWLAKEASRPAPVEVLAVITAPSLCKSASDREKVLREGFALIDSRPDSSCSYVEEIGDGTITELSGTCRAEVLLRGGSAVPALLMSRDLEWPCSCPSTSGGDRTVDVVYLTGAKQAIFLDGDRAVYGGEMVGKNARGVEVGKLKPGRCYMAADLSGMRCSDVFMLEDKAGGRAHTVLTVRMPYSSARTMYHMPSQSGMDGDNIGGDICFLEVECEVDMGDEGVIHDIRPKVDKTLMGTSDVDEWTRTAGGLSTSRDITVKVDTNGLFDLAHHVKSASGGPVGLPEVHGGMGQLEAMVKLALDYGVGADRAAEMLGAVAPGRPASYRVFEPLEKAAYTTKVQGMEEWLQSFDPELQVRIDTPQKQVLATHTPERSRQQQRYGDTWRRPDAKPLEGVSELLPDSAIFESSPEQLAQMSEAYDMPHIFDHGCIGRMAETSYNVVEQIRQYIPDLEQGVDRLFRVLFLLRYRPADFEEAYGKDALLEMEQEMSELASASGDNLLRLLKRFDVDQYSAQEN